MKQSNQIIVLLVTTAFNVGLILPQAQAATKTWSGAGSDANWGTPANWGGTAPVNNDTLIFSGATRPINTNDISNLTIGWLQFANSGFTLNGTSGNLLSLNGPLTNSAGTNILGLGVNVTVQNATWNIASGSELRIAGLFTNNTTANPLATLNSGGTVRFTSTNCQPNRLFTLTSGAVIADGCVLITADGFRLQPPSGTTVFQITNNGSFTIISGGNLRLCQTATGGSSRVDMSSGTLNIATTSGGGAGDIFVGEAASTTTVFNQNGGLVEFTGNGNNRVAFANASASANGTYNLNGGTLWTKQITQVTAGSPGGTFNFNGGTLKPTASSTTFFQGVQAANVQSGGANIDTTNLNITIGQSLAGSGPLTKLGAGTLILSGVNTYSGTTTVSNGVLSITPGSLTGGGGLVVANGGTLSLTNAGSSISVSSLTGGASGTNTYQFNFPSGNPGSATIVAGTVTGNGYIALSIVGSGFATGQFPLINFTSASGLANFHLGSVTPGINASLVTNGSSIQLNIASIGKSLAWSGAANNQWNTSSINWLDLGNGNNPTNYSQSGSFGDFVTFDDTASGSTAVNLTLAVVPASITLNNNGLIYSFTGAGKISGLGSLTKGGFQPLTLGTANDYSGGTTLNAGQIYVGANQALGTGAATLNLGTLASDSTTGRTLSNSIVQNADTGVILGDSVNTGTLTLAGGLDLAGGGGRTLNFNSDVVISGSLTNGGIGSKTGPGTMIIKGNSTQTALALQNQGDVVIDGGTLNSFDGWRLQCVSPGATMRLAVTNGGVFNVAYGGNTGNLRIGLAGGDNSANNILDISGTVNLTPTSAAVNGNNAVSLGSSGANDILYLRSGGLLATRALFGGSPGNAEAHFMGGTIRAIANDSGFISGLTNAYMENGGLTVDTTNFTVTISQALLASGSGGLTKIGSGTLILTGTNTYTGATVVSGGKLTLGPAHASPGSVTVNANSTLAFLQSSPPAKVNLPSVTIGSGTNSALEAQLSVTNAPAAMITNLVLNGSVAVNVTGPFGVGQFPLFGYGTISGSGALTLGSVPLGTVGSLVTNAPNKTIDLQVSSIAQTVWRGNVSGNWDTATTNWTLLGTPVAYSQNADVLFNDSASNSAVNLTTGLTPSTMVVSNNAQSYTFSGSGSLGGNMALVKDGTNTAAVTTANTYTGNTTIKAGKVTLGNATALGASTATVTVQNGATLDVVGNNLGVQPIVVGGSGSDGNGALINTTVDQNNALRAVTLTSDTILRADAFFGIRTAAETDLGFIGNGHKLTKTGANQLNLNGGQTNTNGLTVWNSDLGDVDVQQGTLGIQRRMTMGRVTNTVTVEAGATLQLFTLNQSVMPLQTKPVKLNKGTLAGNGNSPSEGSSFGGPVTLASGTNFVQAIADTTLRLLGPISGTGSLYENSSAAGTISLAGTNTYAGQTVIQSGILALESTALLAATPSITVNASATFDVSAFSPWTLGANQTLAGNGTVNGSVQANGTVSPGASIGALTFNNNLTLAGTNVMELNKDAGLTNDVITVAGTLTYGGRLNVLATGSTTFAVNDTFKLFNFVSAPAGSFTLSLPAGYTWDTTQLSVDGTIKVTAVSIRPHPRFVSVTTSGNSVVLSGTNATGSYVLYSSTNVAAPLMNWTPVLTNTFSGPFSFTNVMDSRSKFYLLQ